MLRADLAKRAVDTSLDACAPNGERQAPSWAPVIAPSGERYHGYLLTGITPPLAMTLHDGLQRLALTRRLALGCVFLWFAIGGVCHFLFTSAFVGVVPPSTPYPVAVVYISGVLELLGAAGLIFRRTRRHAGWGLALLTIAVTPANIYMWQHPELFPAVAESLLLLRLPLQAALILCILWSTKIIDRQGTGC